MKYQVIIPQWENKYVKSKKTAPKYWLWKDREKLPLKYKDILFHQPISMGKKDYCIDKNYQRFLKNTKKVGTENTIILNGQNLYNASTDWRLRSKIVDYYHTYFSKYIKEQISKIDIPVGNYLSISCDIFEIPRGQMPDISNMWILEKLFEDSLTACNIIPDDGPKYVLESGRKRYHWVEKEEDRKLVFNIEFVY